MAYSEGIRKTMKVILQLDKEKMISSGINFNASANRGESYIGTDLEVDLAELSLEQRNEVAEAATFKGRFFEPCQGLTLRNGDEVKTLHPSKIGVANLENLKKILDERIAFRKIMS